MSRSAYHNGDMVPVTSSQPHVAGKKGWEEARVMGFVGFGE